MIQFDYSATDAEVVGQENGLALKKVFNDYRQQIHDAVKRLYETKDEAGGWKKWLNLGYDNALADEVNAYAESVKGQYTDLVILGIGGSSLGGYSLLKALLHPYWNDLPAEKRHGFPRFYFIDNVDSDQISGILDMLNPKTTLINVITKSGTTAETMSAFMTLKAWLETTVGPDNARRQIVATTDKNKGILREIANQEGYVTFEVPDDVGGRFSIFSAVGLLPAALCGVSVKALQAGVREIDAVLQNPDIDQNPAAQNALIQYLMYQRGRNISIFMPYSYRLASVSDWYVQLWAESLGKKTDLNKRIVLVGPTPVRAVGVTDQHSQVQLYNEGPLDKIITFVAVQESDRTATIPNAFPKSEDLAYLGGKTFHQLMTAEFESTKASLTRNGRPHVTITVPRVDAHHYAQLLYLLEVQTALAGDLFGIDPFDQPGVELAKKYTYALMGRKGYEGMVAEAKGENLSVGSTR